MPNDHDVRRDGVATSSAGVLDQNAHTPLLLSVPDAARLLGVSATLLRSLIATGEVPTVRLGRRVLVAYRDLQAIATPNNG